MIRMRFFTITEFEKEEKWLEDMAKKGYIYKKSIPPFFYFFKKSKPVDLVYRFDYLENKADQKSAEDLYEEYGWKALPSMNGFLLFSKPKAECTEDDMEIFSDRESQLEMLQRIEKSRLIPITICSVIVFANLIYQTVQLIRGHDNLDNFLIAILCSIVLAAVLKPAWKSAIELKKRLGA